MDIGPDGRYYCGSPWLLFPYQEEDTPATFYRIIPDLYEKFPAVTTGNASILHLLVSCIDSQQLHTIICA